MRSLRWRGHFRLLVTAVEWISTVASGTGTDGVVIDHLALSIGSAGAWTGVHTLLLDTGHGQWTLRAEETLRPAVRRTSEISLQAGADRAGSFWAALTVGTTGVRSAGINLDGNHWNYK